MEVTGFCELTLESRDPDALSAFYERVVGLEPLSRQSDRIWLAAGRHARLGLWGPGQKEFGDQGGAHVHFAFGCEPGGLDGLERRLRDAFVEIRGPVEHEGGDRSLYFKDPEGNVVEVWDHFERHGRDAHSLRAG